MPQTITLFIVREMPESEQAQKMIEELGVKFEIETCPPDMNKYYTCPFIKDAKNEGYFGISGITYFVEHYHQDKPAA